MHQAEGFQDRGVSVSFSYDPTPVHAAGSYRAVGPLVGWTGPKRGGSTLGPGDDGGAGRKADLGQPPRSRARLRAAGRPRADGDAPLWRRGFRAGARLPVGLQPVGAPTNFEVGVDAQRSLSQGRVPRTSRPLASFFDAFQNGSGKMPDRPQLAQKHPIHSTVRRHWLTSCPRQGQCA